jgi:hypothetical protein
MDYMTETVILIILDESRNMIDMKDDVIDGFNLLIEKQLEIKNDKARVYLIKYNSKVNIIHDGVDLNNVLVFDEKNYIPEGDNVLYDAVGTGIKVVENTKKPSERVIVIIITDGKVNDSEKISNQDLNDIISAKTKSEDWTILFIGENPYKWYEDSGCEGTDTIKFNSGNCDRNFENANQALSYFRKRQAKKGKNLLKNN